MVCVVEVISLIWSVEFIHVDVQIIWGLTQVIFAVVQRKADLRGRKFFPLAGTSLKG